MSNKAFSNARIEVTAADKTKAGFASVNKGLGSVSNTALKMTGILAAAAGVGGMGALIKSSMTAADELAKTSDRLNITTEGLGGMRHAADLAGVSNSALDNSLGKLNVNLARAADGSGAAADAVETLNLQADVLAKMPTDQALSEIADAMLLVEDHTERARLAQDLFGKSGREMITMLEGGSDALADAATEADELGLTISRVDAAKIEQANDAFMTAQKVLLAIGQTIAIEVAPFIQATSEYFIESTKAAGGWQDKVIDALEAVVIGGSYVMDMIQGIEFAWYAGQVAVFKYSEFVVNEFEKIARPIVYILSLIPKMGIEYEATMEQISNASDQMADRANAAFEKMDEIAMAGRASERTRAFFDEIKTAAQEIAEETAAGVEQKRAEQIENLENHLQLMVDTDKNATDEIVENRKQALTDLEKFTAMSYSNQTSYVMSEMESMSRSSAQTSKAMFAVNKGSGIANALIGAYEGANKSMAAYPYPLNTVMAGLSLAAGLANVNAIKSVSFSGSGGSAPSMGGGGGGDIVSPPEDAPGTGPTPGPDEGGGFTGDVTEINIGLHGTGYSKEDVRMLIGAINEEIGDGVTIRTN